MHTQEMIDRTIIIIDNPSYEDRAEILSRLNKSMKAVVDLLLLPNLKDGYDSVNTVVGAFMTDLPATYHKGLYLAQCGGVPVDIHEDIKSFSMNTGGISSAAGDVSGVCAHAKKLVYQDVPLVVTPIDLFFYRLPTPMTDADTSYPDGLVDNDAFDWAIIHDTCKKIYLEIEDGQEGQMINTTKHQGLYDQRILELDDYADKEGKSFATRPSANLDWLGTN